MAETVNVTILQILKIITPEDISKMSKVVKGSDKVSLTTILFKDLSLREGINESEVRAEGEDKKEKENEGKEVGENKKEENKEKSDQEGTVLEAKESSATRKETFILSDAVSTSQFFLREKDKNRLVVEKFRQKQTLDEYKKNSQVDVEQEKLHRDDLQESSEKGILFNKKHF